MEDKILLMEKEIERLEKDIIEIKGLIIKSESPKDCELYLEVNRLYETINIVFDHKDWSYLLGYIPKDVHGKGMCHFLTNIRQQEYWELWKTHGFKIAKQEPVEWQDLYWYFDNKCKLSVSDGNSGDAVYDFRRKMRFADIVDDNNFLRKDSDRRIELY